MANVSTRALNHEQILAYRCQLRRMADLRQAQKPQTPDQPEPSAANGPKRPVAPAGGAVVEQKGESSKCGGVGVFHAAIKNFCPLGVIPNGSQLLGARKNG